MLKTSRIPRTDLPWLITLNVIAFFGFHVSIEIYSSHWFQEVTHFKRAWLNDLVGLWLMELFTIGLALYFAYLVLASKRGRVVTLPSLVLLITCYIAFRSPLITSLLISLGQIEQPGWLIVRRLTLIYTE